MIEKVYPIDYGVLCMIWESAVRNTHDFLSSEDYRYYRTCLPTYFSFVELYGYKSESGVFCGFIGVKEKRIEMLFIHNDWRGKGIGGQLLDFAIQRKGCSQVEVNEQNIQGVGFYHHYGFAEVGYQEQDAAGKPYPIIAMELKK